MAHVTLRCHAFSIAAVASLLPAAYPLVSSVWDRLWTAFRVFFLSVATWSWLRMNTCFSSYSLRLTSEIALVPWFQQLLGVELYFQV